MNFGDGALSKLPKDMVDEIILRLPVRSLCRFKCVSKPWLSFISNPKFAKKHLDLNKKNLKQEGERLLYVSDSLDCYSLDLESSNPTAVQLRFRGEENPIQFVLLSSSCNGLVLLIDKDSSLFMANPSTGECKRLPDSPFFINSESAVCFYGFGYDSSCDDYKMVIIFLDGPGFESDENIVGVYEMKSNSWRRVNGSPYSLLLNVNPQGFFVNGALHWLSANDIIAFNLGSESFYTVPYPRSGNEIGKIETLDVIGDCLGGFEMNFDQNVLFNVWVLKVYGVRDSWVKYSVVHSPCDIHWILPSRTGKLLIYTGTKIASYDLQDGTFEELIVQDIKACAYVTYEESLIRLQEQ